MLTISKPLSGGQARTYQAREFAAKEANYWSRPVAQALAYLAVLGDAPEQWTVFGTGQLRTGWRSLGRAEALEACRRVSVDSERSCGSIASQNKVRNSHLV